MALIAHWPLNGNTNDISGNSYDGTPTNITFTAGKIGQAASFNGSSSRIVIGNQTDFMFIQNFSISLWLYWNGNNSTVWKTILYKAPGNTTGYQFFINNSNQLAFGLGTTTSWVRPAVSTTFPINIWTNVTIQYDGSYMSIYQNGSRILHYAHTGLILTNTNDLKIGSNNSNTEVFPGLINDIRVFNHALTDIEIQEIARAKILHYSFDDMQEPTTNKFLQFTEDNQNPILGDGTPTNLGIDSTNTFRGLKSIKFQTGTSGNFYINGSTRIATDVNSTNWTGTIYIKRVDGAVITSVGTYMYVTNNSNVNIVVNVQPVENGWYKVTRTRSDLVSGYPTLFGCYNLGSGVQYYIAMWQIEAKAYDTEYIKGIRTGLVKDHSGFFNDSLALTEADTPRWIPNTKIGTGAYNFNYTNQDFIRLPNILHDTLAVTISAWVYSNDITKSQNIVSRNGPYFLRIVNSRIRVNIYTGTWIFANGSIPLQSNTWYHLVLTYDGSFIRGYVNGVKDVESVKTGNMTAFSSNIRIGYTTGGEDAPMDGIIDDVRIYATALSDKDILDLYNTKAEIEQSGVLYARDFLSNAEATVNLISGKAISFSALTVNISTQNLGQGKYIVTSTSFISPFTFGTIRLNLPTGILINGLTYNVSLKYRIISGSSPSFSTSDWCDQPVTREAINFAEYTLETAFGSRSTYDNTFKFMDYNFSANTVIEIWDIQLEQKAGRTPFVSTFRPAIELPTGVQFGADEIHETGIANFEDFSTVGITDGLIAYYPLIDNGKDYSGSNFNGTVNNLSLTSGKDNSSTFNFNGVLGNGIFTNNFPLRNVSEFTISLWLFNTSVASARGICGQDDCVEFAIHTSGTILLYTNGHTNLSWTWNTSTYPLNEWHHVVVTNKANLKVLYMDGAQVASVASGGLTVNTGFPFTIGDKVLNQSDSGIIGKMQDIKVFNRALTAEEIKIEYNTMFNNQVQIHESSVVYAKNIIQY